MRVLRRALGTTGRNPQGLRLRGIDVLEAGLEPGGPVRARRSHRASHANHGANQASAIRLDDDVVQERVPRDGEVGMETEGVLGRAQGIRERLRVLRIADDDTVHRDRGSLGDARCVDPINPLALLEEVEDGHAGNVLGDTREQAHGLDDADRMALRRLHGADEAPGCAVKLARRQKLAGLLDGRLDATKMRERAGVRHASQHLRDTDLGRIRERGGR